MLTFKNDLTHDLISMFTVFFFATSAFNEEHQCHHGCTPVITEKLYAINFLSVIDSCRLVPGRFPSWFRLFLATKVY